MINNAVNEQEEEEIKILKEAEAQEKIKEYGTLDISHVEAIEMIEIKHDLLKDAQHRLPNLIQIVDTSVIDTNTKFNLEYNSVGPTIPIFGGYNNIELQHYISSGLICNCKINEPIFVFIRLHGVDNYYITRDKLGRSSTYSKSMLIDCLLQALVKFGFTDIHVLDNSCKSETEGVFAKMDYSWLSNSDFVVPYGCKCKPGVTRYKFCDKTGSAWESGDLYSRNSLPTNLLKICYLNSYPYCLRCMIRHNYDKIERYNNTRISTFHTGLDEFCELLKYDIDLDDIEVVNLEGNQYDGIADTNLYDNDDKPNEQSIRIIDSKQVMCSGGKHFLY